MLSGAVGYRSQAALYTAFGANQSSETVLLVRKLRIGTNAFAFRHLLSSTSATPLLLQGLRAGAP